MIRSTSILKRILVGFLCTTTLAFSFFGVTNHVFAASTTRYVAASGTDAGNCSSSGSPCRTIQYAVNQTASGDRILVAKGTYTYNAGTDPCGFLLTRAVVCFVDKNLTILGGYSTSNWSTADPSGNLTVIDAQSARRGVAIIGNLTNITYLDMEGFTIQNGRAQGPLYNGVSGGRGGGMWSLKAAVTLRDMIFKNNQSIGDNTAAGAGGSADGSGLTIESSPVGTSSLLQRVTFDGNQSHGGVGPERGGVAFGAMFVFASAVTVEDSTFGNNTAQAGNSTGNGTSGGLNADALGGAIALEQSIAALNRIVVTNNQVIGGNAATNAGGAFGGGIYAEGAVSVSISDSQVNGNVSTGGNAVNGGFGAGGGVLVFNSPATIERVQLISNSAIGGNGGSNAGPGGGGGLYLWRTRTDINPAVSVNNAIIANNYVAMGSTGGTSQGGGGGGIQVQGLTATLSYTTIAQNRLGSALISGQGLLVIEAPGVSSTVVNMSNSIVADHTQGGGSAVAIFVHQGNTINLNRGLFAGNTKDSNSSGSPGPAGTFNGLPTMLSASSAGFVSPGSPSFDYHLQSSSAAKDQATGNTNPIDIDGQFRPFNNISDLGADEYWPTTQVLDKVTTGVFRPSNGALYLKNSNTTGFADVQINYGLGGDYPVVGDWDGDGTVTIGVYRNGQFMLRNSNSIGFAEIVFPFGQAGDQPIAGDWNGDGIDTIGVYRNGTFFLRNSNSPGAPEATFQLGNPGDVAIAGDWTAKGHDTTGVFRPSNGALFLKNLNTSGFADVQINYGLPGDKPVVGDWDGNGTSTIGVYRGNQFMLRNSNSIGFADIVFSLGNAGDMPIAGDWDAKP